MESSSPVEDKMNGGGVKGVKGVDTEFSLFSDEEREARLLFPFKEGGGPKRLRRTDRGAVFGVWKITFQSAKQKDKLLFVCLRLSLLGVS